MPSFADDFDSITELRVAGSTPPKELAGSIIHLLNDERKIRLAAIGHQAVGQAVKAIPMVNKYCIAQGYVIALVPFFALMRVPSREPGLVPDEEIDANGMTERTVTKMALVRISPQ
jgi:stage V sporulation protein SpoVS